MRWVAYSWVKLPLFFPDFPVRVFIPRFGENSTGIWGIESARKRCWCGCCGPLGSVPGRCGRVPEGCGFKDMGPRSSMLSGAQLPRCSCGFLGYPTPTFSNTHCRFSCVIPCGSRFPAFCHIPFLCHLTDIRVEQHQPPS